MHTTVPSVPFEGFNQPTNCSLSHNPTPQPWNLEVRAKKDGRGFLATTSEHRRLVFSVVKEWQQVYHGIVGKWVSCSKIRG